MDVNSILKTNKGTNTLRLAIRHNQHDIISKLIENGCEISAIVKLHNLVMTNMKIVEKNALLIHHAIRCGEQIYEDFPKELLPFLIRSDLIPICHESQAKSFKRKLIDVSDHCRKKPKLV